MSEIYEFYYDNQDLLEEMWEDYITSNDWGSGEDRINLTEDIFWEFIEDQMENWG